MHQDGATGSVLICYVNHFVICHQTVRERLRLMHVFCKSDRKYIHHYV